MKIDLMTSSKNIETFIKLLNNSNDSYAILRNYDNLLEDEIYMDGHGDIDLICADSEKLAEEVQAFPHPGHVKNGVHNKTHYLIYIAGVEVSLDLRHVGDGYYCEKWQNEMLENRRLHNGFFVLAPKDHFYTLIYHAIFQKPTFSVDYQLRLKRMADDLGISVRENSVHFYVSLLEEYMRENKYHYEIPRDKHVPLYRKYIQDQSLLVVHRDRQFDHFMYETKNSVISKLVQLKHLIKK